MKNNKICIVNSKIISPFLYFFISWVVVLFLYSLYWIELLPKLSVELFCFFVFAILICIVLFYFSGSLKFKFYIDEKKIKRKLRKGFFFCFLLFVIEAVVAGGFPLLFLFKGNFKYGEFGLPFIHVTLYAFASIYVSISFLAYKITKRKEFRNYTLLFFFPGVLCFTRSFIIYNFLYCIIISFSFNKLGVKAIAKIGLSVFVLGFCFMMLFGYLGEIRSGGDSGIGDYIEHISYPSESFKKTGISPLILWGYDYVVTPLGNLQNTMNSDKGTYYSLDDFKLFLYHFMPDLLKKRVFPSISSEIELIVPYFNVSTIFADAWTKLGWWGIFYSFGGMIVIVLVLYKLKKERNMYSYLSFVYLSVIIFLNMFTNMFNFMGLAPQFWIAFALSFSWKRVFLVCNTPVEKKSSL